MKDDTPQKIKVKKLPPGYAHGYARTSEIIRPATRSIAFYGSGKIDPKERDR